MECLESIETSVDYYVGVDADWEGGLNTAQAKNGAAMQNL